MTPRMLEDDCGNMSTMRVLSFVFTIFCMAAAAYILAIWGYISIKTMVFQPLSFSDLMGIGGGVGAIGFKALQKKYEENTCRPKFKQSKIPDDVE